MSLSGSPQLQPSPILRKKPNTPPTINNDSTATTPINYRANGMIKIIRKAPIALSSDTLQKIRNLIQLNFFIEARQLIETCTDSAMASGIYQEIFNKTLPKTWLAFLQNPHLNTILGYRELIYIMQSAYSALNNEKASTTMKQYFRSVILKIAQNPAWCRILSYRFFLDYLQNNDPLLEHVIYDTDFITHLDYTHVEKLFSFTSKSRHHRILLEYFEELLDDQSSRYVWARECVKYVFLYSPIGYEKITEFECETIMAELQDAFLNDKHFAVTILKYSEIYQFFGLDETKAYQHPLLDMGDYREITEALKKTNLPLACAYLIFQIGNLNQKFQALTDIVASITIGNNKMPSYVREKETSDEQTFEPPLTTAASLATPEVKELQNAFEKLRM